MSHYKEIWIENPDGRTLCALIAGKVGWLMYLPERAEAGFISRNPDYAGPEDATIDYLLLNGQRDSYPASWALPLPLVERTIKHFRASGLPASFVTWHDDSGEERRP